MRFVKQSDLPPDIAAYFASTEAHPDDLTLIIGSGHSLTNLLERNSSGKQSITAAECAAITDAVLKAYSNSGKRSILPAEDELLRPLPESDWEALRANDRNPW